MLFRFYIVPGPQTDCCGHLNGCEKTIEGQQHLFSLVYLMAINTGWKECDPFHHSVITTFKRKSHPFQICTPDISRKSQFHSPPQGTLIYIHILFIPCLQLPFPHQLPHNLHTQPAGWFPPHIATSVTSPNRNQTHVFIICLQHLLFRNNAADYSTDTFSSS